MVKKTNGKKQKVLFMLILGLAFELFLSSSSPALESSPGSFHFQMQGMGLGLGYSALMQESQLEMLSTVGESRRSLSFHLGQSFWQYGGMKSGRVFEIESRIYALSAATRWFFLPESPLYILVGGGSFLGTGTMASSYLDVVLGNEPQRTVFSTFGAYVYSHIGIAFDFFKHFYFDFAIRGMGKPLPLYTLCKEDEMVGFSNRELIYANFSSPKIYGLINLKLGVLF